MKVVLLERVDSLGSIGDVVAVRPGFARNFLLPQSKALRATDANMKLFELQRAEIEARNAQARAAASGAAEKLDGKSFVLIRQAGESGQLYGSVSARDIADAAVEGGYKVDRAQVALNVPIKNLGLHSI
ncbi:MAG: 50S ribosomal protein L9, partial [Caulobacterales bacterium]